jgi:hypothetical protein
MPILEITDGCGRCLPDAVGRTFAAMIFPQAEQARDHAEFVLRTHALGLREPHVVTDPQLLATIMNSRPHPLSPWGDQAGWRRGQLAGMQLAWLYSLRVQGRADASRRLVRHLVECLMTEIGEPCSEKPLNDAWSSHGPVAHLWAAWLLRGEQFRRFEYLGECVPPYGADEDFRLFIWQAEQIRQFAVDYNPTRTARLLHSGRGNDSSDFWELPPNWPPLAWHAAWPRIGNEIYRLTPRIEALLDRRGTTKSRPGGRPRKQVV